MLHCRESLLLLLIGLNNIFISLTHEVDPKKTLVWGLGLQQPQLVFPARYFFIQAVDKIGDNFTRSPEEPFSVDISGITDYCRVWTQILNRQDGSFIVRYRLYQTCNGLQIKILHSGFHVAHSPYKFVGLVHHEECNCPVPNVETWIEQMGCPSTYHQISKDLALFKNVDMQSVVKDAKQRFKQAGSYSLCHYAVIANEVFRECIGEHVGFKMFPDAVLLSLLRKTNLPDVEFLVNLGDWPLIRNSSNTPPLPIFSWCKSDDTLDIVMPTYDLTESTLETMGRVMLDMMSVQSVEPMWENKTEKAIWRGRDSREERLNLVALSRKNPDLIDAALTNFFFFRDKEKIYGPKVKPMSFFNFFQFKYQINIDGTVAAYRFPYLLAGNSVIFKQDSPYFEHFYKELSPMIHYIPFKRDLSNLISQIKWAMAHDEEAEEIGKKGRKFARENLMPRDILCYTILLLKKFSESLKMKPVRRKQMDHVAQPQDEHNSCRCPKLQQTKEEL